MSQSTNTTTTPSRRRRVRRIALTSTALGLAGTVAFAAVLSGASLRGNIGKGQFVAAWYEDSNAKPLVNVYELDAAGALTTTKIEPIDRAVTFGDRVGTTSFYRSMTLPTGQSLFYGEAMVLERGKVALTNGAGRDGWVSGVQTVGTVPAGWKIALTEGCGAALAKGGTPANVKVQITPTNDAPTPLDLTALNLQVVATAGTAPANPVCAPLGG